MILQTSEFWKNRNVFVTGGTGFLGSWLVKDLVEKGAVVICLVRDQVPSSLLIRSGIMEKVVAVSGDIGNMPLLSRVISEYEIETVFHLAAQSQVGVAYSNPVETFEVNIRGTWNLLEVCRTQSTVRRVIVASSDKAYGHSDVLPYNEELPLAGRYPYDVSKSCADLISVSYYQTYQLPVCITRCANLFGGGDINFKRIIPGTIRSVLMNERPIIRSDGKFIRDYLYVRDAVDAYLFLAEKMEEMKIGGESFNISSSNIFSVLEITGKILKLMERSDLPPEILNTAKAEIPEQSLSAEKIETMLGWKPKFPVDKALNETIRWYEDYT